MGMFDSLYVKKANTLIEVQTKQLEQSMERYYWGDQITKGKGISFLIEDFSYAERGNHNDWFIFVLLNGFYVDFAVVNQEKYIPYVQKQLTKLWSNLELQNFTLSSLLEKNYSFSQQKSYLINNLSQKITHYAHYLKEPTKNKSDKSLFNFNLYQDKNVSVEEFLNELASSIEEKQKEIYGNNNIYALEYGDSFQSVNDVGQIQGVEQNIREFIYLNKEKFNFSSDEIVLSHMLQPLILSSDIDLNQKILFQIEYIESLPTYFDYVLGYIKLPSDILQAMIDKYWSNFTYEQKADILSSNLIDDYWVVQNQIINKYSAKELEQVAQLSSFWNKVISQEKLVENFILRLSDIEFSLKNNYISILGAFIDGTIGVSQTNNLNILAHKIINLMEQKNCLYLSLDADKENHIWQEAIVAHPQLEEIKSYYEAKRLESMISQNRNKPLKTLKL